MLSELGAGTFRFGRRLWVSRWNAPANCAVQSNAWIPVLGVEPCISIFSRTTRHKGLGFTMFWCNVCIEALLEIPGQHEVCTPGDQEFHARFVPAGGLRLRLSWGFTESVKGIDTAHVWSFSFTQKVDRFSGLPS